MSLIRANDILQANRGIAPGFESVRLFLAFTILLWHGSRLCHVTIASWEPAFFAPFRLALLPMFFCLSGFLVTGSALRLKSLRLFMTFRVLRIIPALLVEVTLSAIILGGMVTTYPLPSYYTDKDFYAYFGNIIGVVKFTLPGVFKTNLVSTVNSNLWTLPPEFYCYAIIACMIVLRLLYRRKPYLYILTAASGAFLLFYPYSRMISLPGHLPSEVLVFSYMLGSLAFLYTDHIFIHRNLFILNVFFAYICLCFPATNLLG